jgi:hypothetical protein
MNSILQNGKNEGRKPDKNSSRRRLKFTVCQETSTENAVQEFYLSYGLSNSIANPTYTEDSGII